MRVVLLGDDGVGKSAIITCLFKDRFVPNIEDVLPPLFFPSYNDSTVTLVDTSPALAYRKKLLTELRLANCIWLVYSDHYTMERISLFWLPFLRNNGVNLPIILCQNKQDALFAEDGAADAVSVEEEDDVIELMQDFKEIESFVRCSAKEKRNVNEAFYLCQRAIVYPLAPLYDSKIGQLKPLCDRALSRIFFLTDEDQTGVMTRAKLEKLQLAVFKTKLSEEEIQLIHETLANLQASDASEKSLSSTPVVLTPPPNLAQSPTPPSPSAATYSTPAHDAAVRNSPSFSPSRTSPSRGSPSRGSPSRTSPSRGSPSHGSPRISPSHTPASHTPTSHTPSHITPSHFTHSHIANSHLTHSQIPELQPAAVLSSEHTQILYDEDRDGITMAGFLRLSQLYCERGRHETIWAILRHFHYTDSLSLDEKYLRPQFHVDSQSHVELSPDGYQFLVDLFTLFDRDNDGGLSPAEIEQLFTPTPGLPEFWKQVKFPYSTLRNDAGYVSLQGWLAQWSMFVYLEHTNALAYLAMLGYSQRSSGAMQLKSALRVTKPAKKRNPKSKVYRQSTVQDRQVFNCFVFGSGGAGKSTLLSSFLGARPNKMDEDLQNMPHTVVNSVELPGGKQSYLIMQELDSLEDAILNTPRKLDECDVVCLTYDSSDPDSFAHLVRLRERHPELDNLPLVFAALKADQDRAQQRCSEQPDEYTAGLGIAASMHVSSNWPSSLNALFVQLVEAAMHPGSATITLPGEDMETSILPELAVASVVASVAALSWWWSYHRKN